MPYIRRWKGIYMNAFGAPVYNCSHHVRLGMAFPTCGMLLGSKRLWGFWVRGAQSVHGLDWLEYLLRSRVGWLTKVV